MTRIHTSFALRALTLAVLGAGASFSAAAAQPNDDLLVKGRMLVEMRDGVTDEELGKMVDTPGHKRYKLGQSRIFIVDLPANASERAVLARLKNNPHVKSAEQDRLVPSTLAANDPYIGSAWHVNKIGVPTAWDSTQGSGVTVAILDSGIDAAHPDLAPNLVAGYNAYDSNTNLTDVCGHGTSVAGAAAAVNNNALGVAGVAGRSRIMPVRVAYKRTDGSCYASYSTVANGLIYAADNGARIANVSYGGVSTSSTVTSAANYMKSKGGLVFVSSGNTGTDQGYAPNTAMIVVGATDSNDNRASWSSFGSFVSLTAPGSGIWTTRMGNSYASVNGTSYASPVAAGVAALMMAAAPTLSNSRIESLLFSTAVDLGTAGRDNYFGYGRVNAAAAVQAARAAAGTVTVDSSAPSVAIQSPLGSSSVSGLVAVNASASDNVGVTRVELQVNGTTVASDTTAPYAFSWNSAGVANGMANLVAVAYDAAGNVGRSTTVAVNVANATTTTTTTKDTIAPTVRILNPVSGAVSGIVNVSISATDNLPASGLSQELVIDNVTVARGTGGTLSYSWDTSKTPTGTRQVRVVVRDAAGNSGRSSVNVTVRR